MRNRFLQFAQSAKGLPDVVVELRDLGIEPNRLPDVVNGNVMLADLMGNHAEKVEGARMIGLDLQYLPVERLRLLQAAGLMVLQRRLKRVRER